LPQKTSVKLVADPFEFRTQDLPDKTEKRYCLSQAAQYLYSDIRSWDYL